MAPDNRRFFVCLGLTSSEPSGFVAIGISKIKTRANWSNKVLNSKEKEVRRAIDTPKVKET